MLPDMQDQPTYWFEGRSNAQTYEEDEPTKLNYSPRPLDGSGLYERKPLDQAAEKQSSTRGHGSSQAQGRVARRS